jgi:FKBP-type peptidyl-prolyl cis-trans isomerase (trigger factor)
MYKIIKTNKLKNSEVEIEAELAFEAVKKQRNKAIARIQQGLNLPGFRPGHVPESVLVSKIGDLAIWEEAAEIAMQDLIPEIIKESKFDYIGHPQVSITKIAAENPVEFKIRLVLLPEIKLADYKKIAKGVNEKKETKFEVTEKDLEDSILKIRETYAQHYHTHAEGEEHKDDEKLPLPEINEEFLKKLGDFRDEADFKAKVTESIKAEKEHREREKTRLMIADKIITESEIDLPELLITAELNKMEAQFQDDIARYGLKVDDYLKHLKKTMDDMRKEWTPDAEKRAKLQLVLNKISLEANIIPDADVVKKEVEHLTNMYKDADATRVQEYVIMMATNEAVFKMLEEVK